MAQLNPAVVAGALVGSMLLTGCMAPHPRLCLPEDIDSRITIDNGTPRNGTLQVSVFTFDGEPLLKESFRVEAGGDPERYRDGRSLPPATPTHGPFPLPQGAHPFEVESSWGASEGTWNVDCEHGWLVVFLSERGVEVGQSVFAET